MYWIGLVILSLAIGTATTSPMGFLVLGLGCMGAGILAYLNGGKK